MFETQTAHTEKNSMWSDVYVNQIHLACPQQRYLKTLCVILQYLKVLSIKCK